MLKYKKSVLFLIGASLAFALIWGYKISYFVFYMTILTTGILYFWSRSNAKRLEFSQRLLRDYAFVGDTVEIKTMVYNDGFLPVPCVEVLNEMVCRISGKTHGKSVLSLMPFDSRSVYNKIVCKYRGYYTLGPINMTVSDVFGFFRWNKKMECEGNLTVYPRVIKLDKFNVKPMQAFGTVNTKQLANEDYTSISDIRKYYPGDSYKRIHWKVSARKGYLHVKNFDMSGSSEAHIFLNLYCSDYEYVCRLDIEEKVVECATAVINYMLSCNINTSLYTNGSKLSYISGRDLKEFIKFMDELVTVKSNGTVPLTELLESRSKLLPRGASIIIITPGLNDSIIKKLVQLQDIGFDVIVIYIMMEEIKEEYQKIIAHFGIKLYKIKLDDDIKSALEGVC